MIEKESTILIRNDTRERLKRVGHKGQTYDELINKLLDLRSKKIESLDLHVGSLKSSESIP